ncbi:hypothetical protein N7481_001825 [Penicillium waksmanii]|uniref:uncharacterized protein n=1 Tax=Penicillium waksmanii TaxID=69791 RepID=UPI0025471E98|nr:uncharacterized protein N7481_001825 [Penicillium waksmanii]KAJ5994848.1 hypothetical protein N7481_001825 [Penicillium waksmanii]
MSTKPPRTPDRSALGESWVMASTASIREGDVLENVQEKQADHDRLELASPTPTPRSVRNSNSGTSNEEQHKESKQKQKPNDKLSQSSESLVSSSSSWISTSGPELIMPSIYEAPISEASWVAPNMRSATATAAKQAAHLLQKQNKTPSKDLYQGSSTPSANEPPSATSSTPSSSPPYFTFYFSPEIIHSMQELCSIPGIKSLYPSSCVQLDPRHPSLNPTTNNNNNKPITPEETIFAAQTHLESIFTSSLATLLPLAPILKESESKLQSLQSTLQTTFPSARHALALEFQGGNSALRTAVWEFDSLRADLRSAIDSLLASPPTKESTGTSIARDTRLAAQLRRRAEYLDRLRSQIHGKTEGLATRFGTLDDHLTAVDGIISRETRRASLDSLVGGGTGGDGLGGFQSVLHSLSRYTFGTKLFGGSGSGSTGSEASASEATAGEAGEEEGEDMPGPATTLAMMRLAATHHVPVADSVEKLSRQLRDLQRARGSTWVHYD